MIIFKTYMDIMRRQIPIVLLYVGLLVLLMQVFSNVTLEKEFGNYEHSKVRIAVFNYDQDGLISKGLVSYLNEYCEILSIKDSSNDLQELLSYRMVYYILTIPTDFSENFMKKDGNNLSVSSLENTKEASYVNQAVDIYLDYVTLFLSQYPNHPLVEILAMVDVATHSPIQVIGTKEDAIIEESVVMNQNMNLTGFILMICITIIVCSAMYTFRTDAVYKRHVVSPIPPSMMNFWLLLGNAACTYLYTLLYLAILFVLSEENAFNLRTLLYWGNAFIYITSIMFFAYFFALCLKRKRMIHVIVNITGFSLAILSGVFIRQEYLVEGIQRISSLTPMYWFVSGNDMIMKLNEYNMEQVVPIVKVYGIQILFSMAFLCLILVRFKVDSERS